MISLISCLDRVINLIIIENMSFMANVEHIRRELIVQVSDCGSKSFVQVFSRIWVTKGLASISPL